MWRPPRATRTDNLFPKPERCQANDRPSPVSLANAPWSQQALRMAMDQRVFSSSSTHRINDNFRLSTRLRYQERRNLDLLGEYISDIRTVGCIMLLGAVA